MQQTGSLRDWEGGSLLQALKVEGGYMAKDVRGLKELIVVPDDVASKEMEPQSYNHKELNSAHNLNKLGGGSQAPNENTDILFSALWDYEQT